jgi:hypothetical protein
LVGSDKKVPEIGKITENNYILILIIDARVVRDGSNAF